MKTCIVIPVYNHHEAVIQVIGALKKTGLPCIMVNDGSSPECTETLKTLARREKEWIWLLHRPNNGGKGAAVKDGLRLAIEQHYSHAIQIDADGQHCPDDIERFLKTSARHPEHLILGFPHFDENAPKSRLYGRLLTNVWIWINTLSFAIKDGMCGFRCYPLKAVEKLFVHQPLGERMDFDIEIAVRLYWQGVKISNLPTRVDYPLDGLSHFQMWRDNLLISRKHAQLFFGMIIRSPRLLVRHF